MQRVALFAHFDAQDEVKPYIETLLKGLREVCSRIVFVSTSKLTEREQAKLQPFVERVHLRENVGYDFAMWKDALDLFELGECDELVLSNSSVFGPIFPLAPIMDRMSSDPCDFWGMTDNLELVWHLQSYFVVFKRRVIDSDAFRSFWKNVQPHEDKNQVILDYELGLTKHLTDRGFRPGTFAPIDSWSNIFTRWRMTRGHRYNPTLYYPMDLLRMGMPFVKVNLLRDNVGRIRMKQVLRAMKEAGYDERLAQFVTGPGG